MFGSNNKEPHKETKVQTEVSNSETRIGKGATLYGDIETHGNIRLDGNVVGNIRSKARVVLGEKAELKGNLMAQNAEIFGKIEGSIKVVDILTLKTSADIKGDAVCKKIVTESGANFNGNIKMDNAIEIKFSEGKSQNGSPAKASPLNSNDKAKAKVAQ
ncbi:MAG: polymer-forming cytoskeletal protein [Bacteroidota bacterium]